MNVLSTRPTISQGSIKTFTLDMDFSALSDSCVRLNAVRGIAISASNLVRPSSSDSSTASNHDRFGGVLVLIIHIVLVGQTSVCWISWPES